MPPAHIVQGEENMRHLLMLGMFLGALVSGAVHAAVVYSNFGPEPGPQFSNTPRIFGYPGSKTYGDVAQSFVFEASDTPFYLDSIEVAVSGDSGGTGIDVHFAKSAASGLPGTILESSSVYVFNTPTIKTAPFGGTTLIDEPGTYWIWLTQSSGSSLVGASWYLNNTGVIGNTALLVNGTADWLLVEDAEQAYRINGTIVPIPAAIWLFGSGLIGLIGIARRQTS